MGIARVRRIALAAHRGQLFDDGTLFVAHLERVAAAVAELTTRRAARQAAWLLGVRLAGVSSGELLRRGVAAATVRVVEALDPRVGETTQSYVDRLLRDRAGAALVRYAALADWERHLADQHGYRRWRGQHELLSQRLGLPGPEAGGALDEILAQRPEPGGHWGLVAESARLLGDPAALGVLLGAYEEVREVQARNCCLTAIRSAVYSIASKPGNATVPAVGDLLDRWWGSDDPWQALVAVQAMVARQDPADRPRLVSRLGTDRPAVAAGAIAGLHGPGSTDEIEALHRIVTRPDPGWHLARRAAARRLLAIGGPAAMAAFDDQVLTPGDPPWRLDRSWPARRGAAVVDEMIRHLAEPAWSHDAPHLLGLLRAAEAVGPLCTAAESAFHPGSHIDALGRIGSLEAVPTLLRLAGHANPDVRDHALRALDRIGDPRAVDAALVACDDPYPVVRDRAARVVARHGDDRAVAALIRLCEGPHAAAAAHALGRVGDPRALPTLWRLFCHSPDRTTRHAAGRALAAIDGPLRYVPTGDPRIRRAYVWLVGHKPAWNQVGYLVRALRDSDPIVRARAVEALVRLGEPASAEDVRPLLGDPDPRVRNAATTALARLGSAEAAP